MFCHNCGQQLSDDQKFCNKCGKPVGAPAESPAVNPIANNVASAPQNSATPVMPQQSAPMAPPVAPPVVVTPVGGGNETNGYDEYDEGKESKPSFFGKYFVDTYFRHYADFSGRTSRRTFWLSYLAMSIVWFGLFGLLGVSSALGMTGLYIMLIVVSLFSLALFIPGLALSVRRLRDGGHNPWEILFGLIPFIGPLMLLILFCMGSAAENEEEESGSRWSGSDWLITCGCVLLTIVGTIVMAVQGMNAFREYAFSSSEYYYDFDSAVELVEDYDLSDTTDVDEVVPADVVEDDNSAIDINSGIPQIEYNGASIRLLPNGKIKTDSPYLLGNWKKATTLQGSPFSIVYLANSRYDGSIILVVYADAAFEVFQGSDDPDRIEFNELHGGSVYIDFDGDSDEVSLSSAPSYNVTIVND